MPIVKPVEDPLSGFDEFMAGFGARQSSLHQDWPRQKSPAPDSNPNVFPHIVGHGGRAQDIKQLRGKRTQAHIVAIVLGSAFVMALGFVTLAAGTPLVSSDPAAPKCSISDVIAFPVWTVFSLVLYLMQSASRTSASIRTLFDWEMATQRAFTLSWPTALPTIER